MPRRYYSIIIKDSTKKALFKIMGVLIDSIITLTLAIIVAVQRLGNGFSGYGTVRSESMQASGFNVGDIVRVRPQDGYERGDIIVFYRAPQDYGKEFEKGAASRYAIWIHEVIEVKTAVFGRVCYLTKGSSNATDDGTYVPQDFVLGKASKLNETIISVFNFICSLQGIILRVEVPCGIILVYLVWELVMILTKDKDIERSE